MTSVKKVGAKKAASKKGATKKVGAKKAASKKGATKKAATKKAASKKRATKKVAAKKAASKSDNLVIKVVTGKIISKDPLSPKSASVLTSKSGTARVYPPIYTYIYEREPEDMARIYKEHNTVKDSRRNTKKISGFKVVGNMLVAVSKPPKK